MEYLQQVSSADCLVENFAVNNKRKNVHSLQEKSNKLSKMSGLEDEECDSKNLLPTDGSRALSASRILRDLKQPAAPPSEARICAVITPFFMSSKCLNGNLCLFSLLIMFWATQDDWHFQKAILIGLESVLGVDQILQLGYVKSYFL